MQLTNESHTSNHNPKTNKVKNSYAVYPARAILNYLAVFAMVVSCGGYSHAETPVTSSVARTAACVGYSLNNGDRVVFVGDSITERRLYTTYLEAPLSIGKQIFEHGIGTPAASMAEVDLAGTATRFVAAVGVDDMAGLIGVAPVIFQVWVDNVKKASFGLMRCGDAPKVLTVDLRGAKRMKLEVTDGGDEPACDLADWGGAVVYDACNAVKVVPVADP